MGQDEFTQTKSDYSEFAGADWEKGSERRFHWLSLLGPSSCVLLTAAPEAEVAAAWSPTS